MATSPKVSHSCEQVIFQNCENRQDINDLPLQDPQEVWSLMEVALSEDTERQVMQLLAHSRLLKLNLFSPGTSAQKAELVT